jgi:S1-C subfamily serine protease
MALLGALTDNGWIRAIGAAVAVIGVPLVIADRLLPDDPTRARGLVGDVCTVTWALVTFVVAGFAGPARPLLIQEGDRLTLAGHEDLARGAYLLAGARVTSSSTPAAPDTSDAADASAADAAEVPTAAPSASAAVDAGAPKRGADKTPAELFKETSPSVVTISVRTSRYEGGGTGFLIDKEGTIATNHHVIDGAAHVEVKFLNGSLFEEGELLVDDEADDLALLRVDLARPVDGGRVDVKPLTLGNSDDVVVGEHAVVIGNPLGLESTLTDGLVSSRRMYAGRAWIQFSAPIGSGNSGGPVLNMRGEVIGVTTASIANGMIAQNLNLAVPVNELKKLIRTDYPKRRKLGQGAGPGHW